MLGLVNLDLSENEKKICVVLMPLKRVEYEERIHYANDWAPDFAVP